MTEYQKRIAMGQQIGGSNFLPLILSSSGEIYVRQHTASRLKATVTQLSLLRHMKGSPDGGSTWVPIKVDADGKLETV